MMDQSIGDISNLSSLDNIICWQSNLRSSRCAFDVFLIYAARRGASVFFISDPPFFIKNGGSVPGFKVFLPAVEPRDVKCALLIEESFSAFGIFSESGRVCGATLKTRGICQDLKLVCTYIQPSSGTGWESLRDFTKKIIDSPNSMMIVGGDFNAHSPLWGPPDTCEDNNGKHVIEWIDDQDLFIMNKWPCLPTFSNLLNQRSWIDLSLVSAPARNLVHCWTVLDNEVQITDHNTIEFQIKVKDPLHVIDTIPNFKKVDWCMFSVKLHFILKEEGWLDFNWETIENEYLLDSKLEQLEACIKSVIDDLVPLSKRTTKRRTWWNSELQSQHRKTKRAFRKAFKARDSSRAEPLLASAKYERKKLRSMTNKAKNEAWKTFIEENSSVDLWTTFKRVTKARKQVDLSYIKDLDGRILNSPDDMILAMGHKFFPASIPERAVDQGRETDIISRFLQSHNKTEYTPTSLAEVERVAFRCRPFGSSGLDCIPSVLVQKCWFSLGPVITGLFNAVLKMGYFPRSWKRSKVIVIPKGNSQDHKIGSMRPISLLPVIGKLLEGVLNDRLSFHLESMEKLHPNQHGFRLQRGTSSALVSVTSKVESCLSSDLSCYGCSLDIQAAFDSVPHSGLILAAINKGVPPYLVRLLRSFTTGRTSQITVQGTTRELDVRAGTPQGSALSPTLFAMYIDDTLREANLNSTQSLTQAFADDIWITSWGDNDVQAQGIMQSVLDSVSRSISNAGLCLSPPKCQAIKFIAKGPHQNMLPLYIDGSQIQEVQAVKYLGVVLDSKLSYKQHVNHIYRKGNERLMLMRRMSRVYWGVLPNMFHTLVTRTIEPLILYATVAWSKILPFPSRLLQLQKLHRRCGLVISGNLRTTAYNSVHMLSGLAGLDISAGVRTLSQARLLKSYGMEHLLGTNDASFFGYSSHVLC